MILFVINEASYQFDTYLRAMQEYVNQNKIPSYWLIRSGHLPNIDSRYQRELEHTKQIGIRRAISLEIKSNAIKKSLRELMLSIDPRVIYVRDNPIYGKIILEVAQEIGKDAIKVFQLTYPFYKSYGPINWILRREFIKHLAKYDFILPISESMKTYLEDFYEKNRLIVVPMGIIPEHFQSISNSCGSIKRKEVKAIYVGSIRSPNLFAKILFAALEKVPFLKIDIIARETSSSSSRMNRRFLEQVNRQEIAVSSRINFLHNLSQFDTAEIISRADIGVSFVPSSRKFFESSPTKTYEYFAAGKPVVASDCVYEHLAVLSKNDFGVLSPNDVERFSSSIADLAKLSVKTRNEMGVRAKEWVMKHHNYTAMIHKLFMTVGEINHERRFNEF